MNNYGAMSVDKYCAQGVPSPLAHFKGWRVLMCSGDRNYLGSLVTCPGVVEVSATY